MSELNGMSRQRDFGGKGNKDLYDLYEYISKEGMTESQAKDIAEFLRLVGYSARLDALGKKGRKGVYYSKSKRKEEVRLFTISNTKVQNWFNERTGGKMSARNESIAQNFISQQPHLICGNQNRKVHVWQELELGRLMRKPDVIIETEHNLWIVEIKYSKEFIGAKGPIREAREQVRDYARKIRKLGWWKGKEIIPSILWIAAGKVPRYYQKFFKEHEIPFT